MAIHTRYSTTTPETSPWRRCRVFVCIAAVLLAGSCGCCASSAPRLPGSPYPTVAAPSDVWVWNASSANVSTRLLVATLAGAVAQKGDGRFVYIVGGDDRGNGSELWLGLLARERGIALHYQCADSVSCLVGSLRSSMSGYVLCDVQPGNVSALAAISLCGVLGGVSVTPETEVIAKSAGLPLLTDARPLTPADVLAAHGHELSRSVLAHGQNVAFLADYAVFCRALMFYDPSLGSALAQAALERLDSPAVMFGWGDDEHTMVRHASEKGVFVHAAAYTLNFPVLSNMLPAPPPPSTPLLHIAPSAAAVHTVAFFTTDGDNVKWLLGEFCTTAKWWGSPSRGKAPLGWTLSPALMEIAPLAHDYIRRTATPNDELVAGPSGVGYYYPVYVPGGELPPIAQLTGRVMPSATSPRACDSVHFLLVQYLQAQNMTVQVTIDGAPFDSAVYTILQENSHFAGAFYMGNDTSMAGAVRWVGEDAVVLGPRYVLTGRHHDQYHLGPRDLAAALNKLPRTPNSAEGYTVVVMTVWSMTVDDLVEAVSLLDPGVDVVLPSELISRVRRNVPHT